MAFTQNKKINKKYNEVFKKDPFAANTFLLICELADESVQVETTPKGLAILFGAKLKAPRGIVL